MRISSYIILFSLLLFGCSKSKTNFSSYTEFDTYLNDRNNGFIKSINVGELVYSFKLEPAIESDIESQFTIHLRLAHKDGIQVLSNNLEERQFQEAFFMDEILNNVWVRFNAEKKSSVIHIYEKTYGLKGSVDLIFNFEMKKEITTNLKFEFRDKLFSNRIVSVEYEAEKLKKCYVEEK